MRAPVRLRKDFPLLLLLSISLAAAVAAQDGGSPPQRRDLTFAIRSQLVQIHLIVSRGGRLVRGVKASDLSLFEDDHQVEINRLDSGNVPLQVVLLLDTSESMRHALPETQEAAVSFVESMEPGDRITLVSFDSEIGVFSQETDDTEPLVRAIRETEARGGTKLYGALLYAMKLLAGKEGRKVIVLFSDGEDTETGVSLQVPLNAAARYGYPIYCVGAGIALGSGKLREILERLAEVNSGRFFPVEKPRALGGAFKEIATELRSAYVVNYYTKAPLDGKWHRLEIRTADAALQVRHRKGFYAGVIGTPGLTERRTAEAAKVAIPEHPVRRPPVQEEPARAALQELMKAPLPAPEIAPAAIPAPVEPAPAPKIRTPVFKVESRFVEVPVLLEPAGGRNLPALGEKDFRIYEDDSLVESVFFGGEELGQSPSQARNRAMDRIRLSGGADLSDRPVLNSQVLGRYYLVIDDVGSPPGDFLSAKEAAGNIIRRYHNALRPFSLHFTSAGDANIRPEEGAEVMLQRIRAAGAKGNSELTTNRSFMSIYEAFLIERGDVQAAQLAALRYAAMNRTQYRNPLGTVDGLQGESADMIENNVYRRMIQLIHENSGTIARALDGLEAVVSAAAADPGDYPKTVLFLSSGFVAGRASGRSSLAAQLESIIALAKKNGIRIFTLDAAGLSVVSSQDVANPQGNLLALNPHLESIFMDHATGWQEERKSPLGQIAVETGGKFLHGVNDLESAGGGAVLSTGRIYYLGYLSRQPADGRFHRIRIAVSRDAAIVHARKGFFAGLEEDPETLASTTLSGEDWRTVALRAGEAARAGDDRTAADCLEQLVRRFPGRLEYWYNLGVAHLKLENPKRAAEVFRRAFALAPRNRAVGLAFARALAAARYRDAAADTLTMLLRDNPADLELSIQLGLVYEADSREQDAFQAYRNALDATALPPLNLYVLLIRTAVAAGRLTEASVFVRDYLTRGGDPSRIDAWRSRLP